MKQFLNDDFSVIQKPKKFHLLVNFYEQNFMIISLSIFHLKLYFN